ncbi:MULTISPECIES: chromate efflux transporter [Rhizobium]|uniref:Chromate transporter n=1 Tax=Rhizobium tropici TaxID=398 RepID=A0A329YED7_RHITR|nr:MULTISPECIES: chromate efflux transporter [Rhizobium]MBB3288702.1 chromate transporter [Rhizobium sp. BK252]MBB3403161.1 chromate transporter [Rhizobium sp. BK289]MBB3415736.1 chromate transporter [Rhizobium sp. BK284]MBB3483624.1 chromate transporter [Rhizobium sp. BK347]MDK4722395.1 chromate efflux transporter [Rhizobium sp. CNPSo 3968]
MTDLIKNTAARPSAAEQDIVPLSEAIKVWTRVAALSFGGPAGQIAVMHRIVVDEKKWVGEHRFLHALNYCMLLPGPEAHQLAIYIGWLLNRTLGGMIAGILFVLPGFLAILALSYVYVLFGNLTFIEGMFFGLKCAVLAVVIQAVFRIGSRALKNNVMVALAAVAFVAIFFLHVPFPLIIVGAGLIGYLASRGGIAAFRIGGGHKSGSGTILEDSDSVLGEEIPLHARPNLAWSLKTSGALAVAWLIPVAALLLTLGPDNVFSKIGIFFSEMAVVTFGGAYAVLAYVAQEAVQQLGWLRPGEMLDGLGMAETTPGPLIMVTQFVGFLAGYRSPGTLNPLAAATFAALLTTWVTFLPSFLWIFAGAPFIEKMRGNVALTGAMSAITAAVVGVILNLAIWFGLHVLFRETASFTYGSWTMDVPVLTSLSPPSLMLTLLAAMAIFRLKMSVISTLLASAALGVGWTVFVS